MDAEKRRESQRRACRKYYERTKDKHKVIVLRLNKEKDADVLKVLESAPSKIDYIRELVRKDSKASENDSRELMGVIRDD